MRVASERLGWTLAAVSLAINILLSVAHMGLLGERVAMGDRLPSVTASVSTEAALLTALAELCTSHGLAQHDAGKDRKPVLFPTCPLCFFFAATTLVLALGNLLLVLHRRVIGRIAPLAATRRPSEFFQHLAQPRAPPFHRIAA